MRRQHTRTPQVSAPHSAPAHNDYTQHQRATNFFLDRLRSQATVHATPNGRVVASNAPLWPMAISVCSFLILLICLVMLILMTMFR